MNELEILLKLKAYMEKVEEQIDGEWGDSRPVSKIIDDFDMPEEYDDLLRLIETKRNGTM